MDLFWPDVFTTMTATANARINNWLHGADIIQILVGVLLFIEPRQGRTRLPVRSKDYTTTLQRGLVRNPGVAGVKPLSEEPACQELARFERVL
jgi:hypothetical protein